MEYKDYCGTCLFCKKQGSEYVCTCEDSEAYGYEIMLDDGCDEYVRRSYGSREQV